MPLRKIESPEDWGEDGKVCLSLEHSSPSHMFYEPGTYEWTCPVCGEKTVFTVPKIIYHTAEKGGGRG